MNTTRVPASRDASMGVPKRLVLLHTSDACGVVGVADGQRVVGEVLESRGQHARSVLGALDRVLRRAALVLDAVGGCVVTHGPGSFTGIRVGLATAQGLAAARGWPVWVCDSLRPEAAAVMRLRGATPTGAAVPVAVVQDARRGEVYAALYDVSGRVPHELVAPFCAEPGAAGARLLAASPTASMIAVGTGAAPLAPLCGAAATIESRARPSGLVVLEALVDVARAGGCRQLPAHRLEPTYLRQSDAEIKRQLGS